MPPMGCGELLTHAGGALAPALEIMHRGDWYFVSMGGGELQTHAGGTMASALESVHRGDWYFVPSGYGGWPLVSSARDVNYADDRPQWDVDDDYFGRRLEESGKGDVYYDAVSEDAGVWDVDDEYLARLEARIDVEVNFDRRNHETVTPATCS